MIKTIDLSDFWNVDMPVHLKGKLVSQRLYIIKRTYNDWRLAELAEKFTYVGDVEMRGECVSPNQYFNGLVDDLIKWVNDNNLNIVFDNKQSSKMEEQMTDSKPNFYAIVQTRDPIFGGSSARIKKTLKLSATNEKEAVDELQKYGYNEFEILQSVGRYRKKQVVELEKY